MPPRISNPSSTASTTLARLTVPSSSSLSSPPPSNASRYLYQPCSQTSASFSTSASHQRFTLLRREFRKWINGAGAVFREHKYGKTNYIQTRHDGDERNINRPFPLNPLFKSEPVLDDRARELIWKKVMQDGEAVKAVSAELGVDIRRVAAIVRLKEVEKDWVAKGIKLAKPYTRAILSMVPTRGFKQNLQNDPFESINDLHIHPLATKQIFWPTSESRHFTRADAANAFHFKLLPADKRVPHPELIQMERELLQGRPPYDAAETFKQAVMESEGKAAEQQLAKAKLAEKYTTRVHTNRFEFRFKQINSEDIGPTGRARKAVGWRYGAPFYDRSRGQVKIPTSVP
ncbi:hypothetical protein AAE478_008535 [Parahypoxylon ruwenzoriense]